MATRVTHPIHSLYCSWLRGKPPLFCLCSVWQAVISKQSLGGIVLLKGGAAGKVNSLAPKIFKKNWISNFQASNSDWWLRYHLWNCPQMNVTHLTYKSTLAQVMAWCSQATSQNLSQCWPISLLHIMVTLAHNELNNLVLKLVLAGDILTYCLARASAAMVLTITEKW